MREQWLTQIKPTLSERDFRIVEKASRILLQNIVPVKEDVLWKPYRAISPSMTAQPNYPDEVFFPGIWNWDSAFHMAGVARFDKKLAQEQMEAFFLFQKENGMLPDLIQGKQDRRLQREAPRMGLGIATTGSASAGR